MNGFLIGALVGLLLLALPCIWAFGIFNNLVGLRNRYKNAYSQIDVQLKRRYDLIPNLVETAKGYLKHERETLEAVIAARNQAVAASQKVVGNPEDPQVMKSLATAEASLSGVLGRLLAVSEAYPELKANQNMLRLTEELTSTENKLSFARQAYNDAVMTYNTQREVLPNSLIANSGGFAAAVLYEIEEAHERKAINVQF